MKKIILLFIFFLCVKGFAQSNGITYQAVILKPTNKISSVTSENLPVANKNVCMQFQFVDEFSKIEYQEVIQTTTDQYGMVNLVIGTGTRNGGYASSFNDITWVAAPKRLAVSINISGDCSSFTEISNQPFTTVPFAYAATNSTNVTGVVAIENGGTNATTIIGAKTTLELDQVNNTSDAVKPISDATKSALQLKEDIANKSTNLLQDGTSDVKFPTVKATKTYVDTGINTVFTTIQSALDLKANLASPTFTGTVSGIDKTMVGLVNVDNTSDANKPVSVAAQSALDLKANLASPTFTGTVLGIDKTMVGLANVDNTSDANKPVSAAAQTALDLKANLASPTFTGTVSGIDKTMIGLANVDNTSDANKPVSAATQTALDLKANLASPTFTGTVSGIDKTMVGLSNIDNTSDANKPVSSAAQNAFDLKANLASPTFTGTVSGIDKTMVGLANVDNTSDLNKPVSSATQTALDLKANLASPTFTGTVSGIDKTMVGLSNVDNTSDANKPVSAAAQTALDLKANLASPTFTGTVSGIDKTMVGLSNVDNTSDANKPLSSAVQNALDLKANLASPTFTGTVSGIDKTMVGLANVDNTSDANKPTSAATQSALDLKANLASPTFTGTVSGIDKTMIGLANVDNTSDVNKPVSAATQSALDLKANLASPTFTGTVSGIDKTMVGLSNVNNTSDANKPVSAAAQTALDLKANLASPTFTGTVSGIDKTMVGLGNVDDTSDANKPISAPAQTALDLKANSASPTFTGIPVAPTATATTNSTQIATTQYVTNAITTSGSNFLPLTGGTLSGTLSGILGDFSSNFKVASLTINGSSIWEFGANGTGFSLSQGGCCSRLTIDDNGRFGIGANYTPSYQLDVDGDGRFTSSVTAISFIKSGGSSTQFLKADGTVDSNRYASIASPTFTGTVSGIDKTMVGLGNVDDTSDANKPVSAAAQVAFNFKANIASPTFTGTPLAPTAAADTNSDQVATTAFVTSAISAATIPDATNSVKGKIQLAGDLTGTADLPAIANDAITSTKIKDGEIVNVDISSTAEIQDTKLATITTAGKVSNSATTATELNTGSSIVSRDIYGSFAAGNITAAGLTTSDNINVHGITIGTKGGSNNIGIGDTAFTWSSPIGNSNTVLGIYAFTSSSGSNNTAIGNNAIRQGGGSGDNNTAVGAASLSNGQAANNNTAIGVGTLTQSTGTDNTALGYNSGSVITTGTQNTFLGSTAAAQNGSESINNATAIGYGAVVNSSNTIQLGNTSVINVKTSGTITAGSITIPNTDGTVGQVLATNGLGILTWITPSTTATAYSGVLPVINGGTGSSTQNFVDLTNNQTIDGIKNFSADAVINGVTVGRGNFNENSNTAVGLGTLANNAGYANTGVGRGALASNGAAGGNTALGYIALSNNVSGTDNVAIGTQTLQTNVSGSQNTAIGKNANVATDGISNSVAIGANAIVTSSNTIQLGSDGSGSHTPITDVKTSGVITAAAFKVAGGTAAQFLKADGSVSTQAITEVADEFSASTAQTSFTLTQTKSTNSKVKMYINGIRISNTAYSVSGNTLTYIPSNNGSYALSVNDRIQFDYFY